MSEKNLTIDDFSIWKNDALRVRKDSNSILSKDFKNLFTSDKSHLKVFSDNYFDHKVLGRKIYEDDISIAEYQNLLVYTYVKANFPSGATILEVGGINNGISEILSQEYEVWELKNTDELKSTPTLGTRHLTITKINEPDRKFENSYSGFDFIFSISGFEDLVFDDKGKDFGNIIFNLEKLTKPGGLSLYSFPAALIADTVRNNLLFYHFFKNYFSRTKLLTGYVEPGTLASLPDLFQKQSNINDIPFFGKTGKLKDTTGKVFTLNLFLKKDFPRLSVISGTRPHNYLKQNPAYFFHHLIKCGGSSLGVVLSKWFNFQNDLFDNVDGKVGYSGELNEFVKYKFNLENVSSDTCIRGHFQRDGFYIHQRYPEIMGRDDIKIFTFVRDPLKVLISLYYFGKKRDYDYHSITLQQYLKTTKNFLSYLLPCDESNYKEVLDRYFFIGIVDRMQESFDKLAMILKKKPIEVPTFNTTEKDHQVKELTPEFIAEVKERNKLDYLIYNYAVEKFNKL
ncbi:MAG: hypothetical protein ABI528_03560 [bacterium]